MKEAIWQCKIGGLIGELPSGAYLPMRNAVEKAFNELTGRDAQFIFSGWSGKLSESQRAVVENRLPRKEPISVIVTPGMHSEGFVTMFLGFVCGDLPELYHLECPKMLESWDRFKETMGKQASGGASCGDLQAFPGPLRRARFRRAVYVWSRK